MPQHDSLIFLSRALTGLMSTSFNTDMWLLKVRIAKNLLSVSDSRQSW